MSILVIFLLFVFCSYSFLVNVIGDNVIGDNVIGDNMFVQIAQQTDVRCYPRLTPTRLVGVNHGKHRPDQWVLTQVNTDQNTGS